MAESWNASEPPRWLSNATIIDSTGQAPFVGSVRLENGQIAEIVHHEVGALPATNAIDLAGFFLLPGLWCAHSHPGDLWPTRLPIMETETTASRSVRAGRNFIDALRHGVTGVRTCGETDYIDVAWKQAFASGLFAGPRVFASCYALICTGGHGARFRHSLEVDGPEEMRRAVRAQIKNGADLIKLCVTGAEVLVEAGHRGEVQLTLEEIRAATEVAHDRGIPVTAHTGSSIGIARALDGGVDCIEHGYELDDAAAARMAEAGVFLVPTLNCTGGTAFFEKAGMPEDQVEKSTQGADRHRESLLRAVQAGVRVVVGADNSPIGEITLYEMELMAAAGMSALDVIAAGTRNAALLCGVGDELGTIEVGRRGDLLVVDGDPTRDVGNLRRTQMVLKDGLVVSEGVPDLSNWWSAYY